MERKNTGQLSLACTGNLRDNRQLRRLGSVLPSSNAISYLLSNCFIFNAQLYGGKIEAHREAVCDIILHNVRVGLAYETSTCHKVSKRCTNRAHLKVLQVQKCSFIDEK